MLRYGGGGCYQSPPQYCHFADGRHHVVIAKFMRDTMAEASKQFRHCFEAVWRLEAIFSKRWVIHGPVHILSKFGINIFKIYCFIAFLLKNCYRGQNTMRAHTVLVRNHANRLKNKRRCSNPFTWFIFNLQRRKMYTVLYNNIQWTVFRCVVFTNAKPLTLVDSHQCKVQISLHSGPMLKIDCHIFNKPQASPFPQVTPFSTPHTHTCDTILVREDDIIIVVINFTVY
jgi:hypothetical protein